MDHHGIESANKVVDGLGLLPVETELEEEKTVRKVSGKCALNGSLVTGYEIHMGRTRITGTRGEHYLDIREPGKKKTWEDGWSDGEGLITGTYVHGIFDNSSFRKEFLNVLRRSKGIKEKERSQRMPSRSYQYDRLADHFEKYCDIERIIDSI
jgi:adenosylcobyric acid synthase